jgi:hypothetical protein
MPMTRAVIAAAAVALMLSAALQATVTIPTDLADVVSLSTVIVRGRVVDTRAFTDVANGPVVTAVTVTVAEVLKGTAESAVTFRVHGGDLGRYRQVMIGAPTFRVGDDAYLFLKRAPDGVLWPVGMGAGVYKISPSAPSGPLVVNPPVVAGVTATAGAQIVRGDARRKPMGIGDFASVVRLLMAVSAGVGK